MIPNCNKSEPDHHHREHGVDLIISNAPDNQHFEHDDGDIFQQAEAHYVGVIVQVNAVLDPGLQSPCDMQGIATNTAFDDLF